MKAKVGWSISVDIFTFVDGRPWSPTLPVRRPMPFKDDGGAWHFDGALLGIVPNGTEPALDTSPNCTGLAMADVPWVRVSIPVWRLVELLVAATAGTAKPLTRSIAEGAVVTGGIVLGPETWGRHWTVAEVKDRTLRGNSPPDFGYRDGSSPSL